MPRACRLDAPDLIQHVLGRGIEKKPIFLSDEDYAVFVERLGNILVETSTPCYAWCLMPNHFHLLLQTRETPLQKIMQRLLTAYALYFNKRHKRVGHLFQNRYKSIIVSSEIYLVKLITYIHANPYKTKLVQTFDQLLDYPWSGNKALVNKTTRPWQDTQFVINLFGNKLNYLQKLVVETQSPDIDLDGGGKKRTLAINQEEEKFDPRVLGSLNVNFFNQKQPLETKSFDSLYEIIDSICSELCLSKHEVIGRGRKSSLASLARSAIIYQAVKNGFKQIEVGEKLGISPAAVSKILTRSSKLKEFLLTKPEKNFTSS